MPMVMRKLVVLPAPFRPSRPTISPWSTWKDTPLTTGRPSYRFSRSCTLRMTIAMAVSISGVGGGAAPGSAGSVGSGRPARRIGQVLVGRFMIADAVNAVDQGVDLGDG